MKTCRVFALIALLSVVCVTIVQPVTAQEALTQTFSSADGVVSFSYPEGWLAENYSTAGYITSNNADIVAGNSATLTTGTAFLLIFAPDIVASFVSDPATATPRDVLAGLQAGSPETTVFGDAIELTLGGRAAIGANVTDPDNEGAVFAIQYDNGVALALGQTFPGEFTQFQATFAAILDTMTYVVPDPNALQHYISEDGSLSFDYPNRYDIRLQRFTGSHRAATGPAGEFDSLPAGRAEFEILTRYSIAEMPTNLSDLELVLTIGLHEGHSSSVESLTLGVPAEITLGEGTGWMLTGTSPTRDGFFLVFTTNGQRLVMLGFTGPGELAQHQGTFLSVAASVRFDRSLERVNGEVQGELLLDTPINAAFNDDQPDFLYPFQGTPGEVVQFTLDEPEGVSEYGFDVLDTQGLRIGIQAINQIKRRVVLIDSSEAYIVRIHSFGDGSTGFTLSATQLPNAGTLEVGQTVAGQVTLDTPLVYRFAGREGDLMTLTFDSGFRPFAAVMAPGNAAYLAQSGDLYAMPEQFRMVMPTTGTYSVMVTGNIVVVENVTYTVPLDFTLTLATDTAAPLAFGETVTGTVLNPIAPVFYQFEGTAGDVVTISSAWADFGEPDLHLYLPGGYDIPFPNPDQESIGTRTLTLPVSGTYTIGIAMDFGTFARDFTLSLSK